MASIKVDGQDVQISRAIISGVFSSGEPSFFKHIIATNNPIGEDWAIVALPKGVKTSSGTIEGQIVNIGTLLSFNDDHTLPNGAKFNCKETVNGTAHTYRWWINGNDMGSTTGVYLDTAPSMNSKLPEGVCIIQVADTALDNYLGLGISTYEYDYRTNIRRTCVHAYFLIAPAVPENDNVFNGVNIDKFPGDTSEPGGGGGKFDGTSDAVDFPTLPSITAISSGMCTMFNPSTTTLRELSKYLWQPTFVDAIAKLFQSPMEAILDLSLINITPDTGDSPTIAVGWISTGIAAPRVTSQYKVLGCGVLHVDEYWGSALDYNPYTTVELYLPFIGLMRLDTDDVMGADLEIRYYIDLLTGTIVAMIKVTKGNLSSILYQFSGNASSHIPLSATNMSQLISSVMSVAAQIGIGVATGGGGAITAVSAGSAMNAIGGKMHVEKGGRLDTTSGALSNKKPYLIITRPLQSLASGYNTFKGYPANISAILGTLTGYTEVEFIHVEGFNALEEEKSEIERLLKEGVII